MIHRYGWSGHASSGDPGLARGIRSGEELSSELVAESADAEHLT